MLDAKPLAGAGTRTGAPRTFGDLQQRGGWRQFDARTNSTCKAEQRTPELTWTLCSVSSHPSSAYQEMDFEPQGPPRSWSPLHDFTPESFRCLSFRRVGQYRSSRASIAKGRKCSYTYMGLFPWHEWLRGFLGVAGGRRRFVAEAPDTMHVEIHRNRSWHIFTRQVTVHKLAHRP